MNTLCTGASDCASATVVHASYVGVGPADALEAMTCSRFADPPDSTINSNDAPACTAQIESATGLDCP